MILKSLDMFLKLNFMSFLIFGQDLEKRAGFQQQEGRNSYNVDYVKVEKKKVRFFLDNLECCAVKLFDVSILCKDTQSTVNFFACVIDYLLYKVYTC